MGSFVAYVPTPYNHINPFFELAPVSANDVVYDLGSGDGRLLFAALERGAGKAVGVELYPEVIKTAWVNAKEQGLENKVTFLHADVMTVNLSEATIIFCYLITKASAALKPKFEADLKPGARVVMESFPVPGWKAVKVISHDYKTFFYYQMPPEIDEK
jgi:16S rRNA G966 N2-methylase RsmD